MADRFDYDVFLAHNSQDKPRVRKVAERLKQAGLRVWLDEWVIKPGDDVYLAIERGLEAARVQVLCLSPAALGSEWVTLERSTVLFRDPTNQGRRFVPLLLADCTLPDALRRYKYVDFRQETQTAFDELLAACREEAEAAPPTPQPEPKEKPTKAKAKSKKKPAKRKPEPVKPPQQAEPLAVLQRKLTGHKGWVYSVAVSPDGSWAASGSEDKTIKIWDLETGQCRATLQGHTDPVRSVAIAPDGKHVFSVLYDEGITTWQIDGAERVQTIETVNADPSFHPKALALLPSGDKVVCVGAGMHQVELWDLGRRVRCWGYRLKKGFVRHCPNGCVVAPDGGSAFFDSEDNGFEQINLSNGKIIRKFKGHTSTVSCVQVGTDGEFAFSGSDDKTVKVWDLAAGTCVGTLEGHEASVESIAVCPDGNLIASAG